MQKKATSFACCALFKSTLNRAFALKFAMYKKQNQITEAKIQYMRSRVVYAPHYGYLKIEVAESATWQKEKKKID